MSTASTTEEKILSTWLLVPASLPSIMSMPAFTRLFPAAQATNPHIRRLYHDLQHQRASLVDAVAQNVAAEVARGHAQRRRVLRARRGEEKEEPDAEVDIEHAFYGATSHRPDAQPHTLSSIVPELARARHEMEAEVARLDAEAAALVEEIQGVVGGMSDLRYGKVAKKGLREEVLAGLQLLQAACHHS